jgi:hypothetical protein
MPTLTAADSTFVRLLCDITLARRLKGHIAAGLVDGNASTNANALERDAWQHLANYTAAQAFASDMSSDEGEE